MRNIFLCIALLELCMGTCWSAPKQEFAYIAMNDGTVQGCAVDSNGHLTVLPFAPTRASKPQGKNDIEHGTYCAAHPDKPIIYVSSYRYTPSPDGFQPEITSTLQPFRVDTTGHLKQLTSAVVPVNTAIVSLKVDPKGRFVYAFANGATVVYSVRYDGTLRYANTQQIEIFESDLNGDTPLIGSSADGGITITPSGQFAYTYFNTGFVDHSEYEMRQYQVTSHGLLHLIAKVEGQEGSIINSISVTPDSKHVYITYDAISYYDRSQRNGIWQYRVRKNGTLAPLSPPLGGKEANGAFITRDGEHLDAAADKGDTIYRIRKNGTLARSFFAPCPIDATKVDPSSYFLYSLRQGDTQRNIPYSIIGCAVHPNGVLGLPFVLPVKGEPKNLAFVRF